MGFQVLVFSGVFLIFEDFNILPKSGTSFDCTRDLSTGDIIFSEQDDTIPIEWSKTLQDRRQVRTIAIPWVHPTFVR